MNGLSPVAYSIDFAANATGMTIAALVAARLAGKVSTRKIVLTGQIAALAAGTAMLTGAMWFGTPLLLAIICFFVLMTAQGLLIPNAGALASAEVPDHPGTGSALLGCVQWVAAGVIPPIAGLGGATTAVPMASSWSPEQPSPCSASSSSPVPGSPRRDHHGREMSVVGVRMARWMRQRSSGRIGGRRGITTMVRMTGFVGRRSWWGICGRRGSSTVI